ncbi:unnamed protein product [Amoebophrya sp. A25]|nr:unnamed protein product [Amoebophrya sp. A25]|eukprot:GSA25T00025189001.1
MEQSSGIDWWSSWTSESGKIIPEGVTSSWQPPPFTNRRQNGGGGSQRLSDYGEEGDEEEALVGSGSRKEKSYQNPTRNRTTTTLGTRLSTSFCGLLLILCGMVTLVLFAFVWTGGDFTTLTAPLFSRGRDQSTNASSGVSGILQHDPWKFVERPEGKAFAPQEKDKTLPVAPQEKRMDKIQDDETQDAQRPVEKMANAYTMDVEVKADGLAVALPARTNRSSSQSMMQMTQGEAFGDDAEGDQYLAEIYAQMGSATPVQFAPCAANGKDSHDQCQAQHCLRAMREDRGFLESRLDYLRRSNKWVWHDDWSKQYQGDSSMQPMVYLDVDGTAAPFPTLLPAQRLHWVEAMSEAKQDAIDANVGLVYSTGNSLFMMQARGLLSQDEARYEKEKKALYAVLSGGAQVYVNGDVVVSDYLSKLGRTLDHLLEVQAEMIKEVTTAFDERKPGYHKNNFPIFAFATEDNWFLHPDLLDKEKAVEEAGGDGKKKLLVDAALQQVIYGKSEDEKWPALAEDKMLSEQEQDATSLRKKVPDGGRTWRHMGGYLCANLPWGSVEGKRCADMHNARRKAMPLNKDTDRKDTAHILYIKGLGAAKDKLQCFASPLFWRTLYRLGFRKFKRPQGKASSDGSPMGKEKEAKEYFELKEDMAMLPEDAEDFAAFLSRAGTLRVMYNRFESTNEHGDLIGGELPQIGPFMRAGTKKGQSPYITMDEDTIGRYPDLQFDLQIVLTSGACEFAVAAVGVDKLQGNQALEVSVATGKRTYRTAMSLGDSNNDEASMRRVLASKNSPPGGTTFTGKSGHDIFVATASRNWIMGPCVNGDNVVASPLLPDPHKKEVAPDGFRRVVPGFAPYAVSWFAKRLWKPLPAAPEATSGQKAEIAARKGEEAASESKGSSCC